MQEVILHIIRRSIPKEGVITTGHTIEPSCLRLAKTNRKDIQDKIILYQDNKKTKATI